MQEKEYTVGRRKKGAPVKPIPGPGGWMLPPLKLEDSVGALQIDDIKLDTLQNQIDPILADILSDVEDTEWLSIERVEFSICH